MNIRTTITALSISVAACVCAQTELTARDTIVDKQIVLPSSFDTDFANLQENWYMQRYAVLDSCARVAAKESANDEVYISRLQRLPTVIEMPYNSVVKQYIEMYANKKSELVEKMLGMSLYYMPIFESALEKHQVPQELKYLPIVESALNPNAVSKAGAGGLWQFMPATAVGEGLEVNSLVDERRDPIASSDAAARYLKKLYNIYDDWTLAIAAYNCGPGNVNKAIKKANGKKDYWEIYFYLPAETRGYVPAFIAANYIMTYFPEHGISHALARRPMVTDTVHINQRVHFQQIADVLDVPIDEIRVLNPQFRADVVPGNIRPYSLTLPSVQAYCYAANEDSIVNYLADRFNPRPVVEPGTTVSNEIKTDGRGQYTEETTVLFHKVKSGETLKSIAQKYGVTAQSIRQANNLSSSRVRTGKQLRINVVTKKYITEGNAPADTAPNTAQLSDSTLAMTPENAQLVADCLEIVTETVPPVVEQKPVQKPAQTPAKTTTPKQNKPKATPAPQATYKVKKGDTLGKIASMYGVTVNDIKVANGLRSDRIQIGQSLKIPPKKSRK